MYRKLERKELHIPSATILQTPYRFEVPYFILGDKAFTLNEYTMKPCEGIPDGNSKERIFNYRLSRARRVVENSFGILSAVYRLLRKPILLEPEKATKVVLAKIYLYNYLRKHSSSTSLITPPGTFDREENGRFVPGRWRNEENNQSWLPFQAVPRRGSNYAQEIRSFLANHFVTNGSIPWQNNYQ